MVDNLVTYIENENFKNFTIEFYETFNFKDFTILTYVCIDICVCVCVWKFIQTNTNQIPKQKFMAPPDEILLLMWEERLTN